MDLPVEIHLDIFEQLNFKDLFSLSQTHSHIRDVVDVIMKRNISNKMLKIRNNILSKFTIQCANDRSSDLNFESTLYFLRHFGHHITHLLVELKSYYLGNEYRQIFKSYIGRYVAAQLKEIDINFAFLENNPLAGFQATFPLAKVVHLRESDMTQISDLRTTFPMVESLDFSSMELSGDAKEYLNVYFPHLKRLAVPKAWHFDETNLKYLKQTLHQNPQIKYLSIPQCTWRTVQFLSEYRPNLEGLEISEFVLNDGDIPSHNFRFSNMKVMKIVVSPTFGFRGEIERIPLEFGQLEEIEFNRNNLVEHWIGIVLQNRNIKKIAAHDYLTLGQLQRIANGLPKLEEIDFKIVPIMFTASEEIVEFLLRDNKQLKRISFQNWRTSCNEVSELLISKWKNVKNTKDICAFIRI